MERNGTLQWEHLFLQVSKLVAGDLQTRQLSLLEDKQMQIVNLMTSEPATIGPRDMLSKAKNFIDAGTHV